MEARTPNDVDEELHRIAFEEIFKISELAAVRVCAARSLLHAVGGLDVSPALACATVLMGPGPLERNLSDIACIAQLIAEVRPKTVSLPQLAYLRGIDRQIDDSGR